MRKSLQSVMDEFHSTDMHTLRFNVRIYCLLAPNIIKTIIKAQNSAIHFIESQLLKLQKLCCMKLQEPSHSTHVNM